MCVSKVWTDEEMNERLAEQPEVIEVWKSVIIVGEAYQPPIADSIQLFYGVGAQTAKRKVIDFGLVRYWSGFHFFTNRDSAAYFAAINDSPNEIVIKCLTLKRWITAIGTERWGNGNNTVLIAFRAIFPHYPETEARREDIEPFLEKQNQVPALLKRTI